jgi:hypothetical protein
MERKVTWWTKGFKQYKNGSKGKNPGQEKKNTAEGMDFRLVFFFVVCCVCSGLCDGLITHSEESYRFCVCLIVCDVETSTMRRLRFDLGCCATGNKCSICEQCWTTADSHDRSCNYLWFLNAVHEMSCSRFTTVAGSIYTILHSGQWLRCRPVQMQSDEITLTGCSLLAVLWFYYGTDSSLCAYSRRQLHSS